MNFFDHQRAARSSTLKLVFLFIVAVVAMVAFIDAAAAVAMTYRRADPSAVFDVVVGVTAVTLLIIAGGMITKTVALRQGGAAVAASVGAVQVDPTSSDPQLRRLVNIVEEMSLASGVPAPRLFVLPEEPGINAFAAGFTPADAAITVTSGALSQLNRDELQGVIAHEFSHILNGDIRLNIRLIGLLNGILLIGLTGLRVLQFGGGRGGGSKNGAPIWMIALAMMVLGFIGVFFANIIKAAVSRQREWLADASAVQFTRQTDGLVGALKKIAGIASGSALRDARSATEVSHMLFGEGRRSFRAWYATHPPLADRIKALDPSFDPREVDALKQRYGQRLPDGLAEDAMAGFTPTGTASAVGAAVQPAATVAGPFGAGRRGISPEQVADRAGTLTRADLQHGSALHATIPPDARRLATQPSTAAAAIIALLLARPGDPLHARQLASVAQRLGHPEAQAAAALVNTMTVLPAELRLPLVDLAIPQLAAHPPAFREALLGVLNELAVADGSVSMFEYCVTRLVWSYLQDAANPHRRSKVGHGSLDRVRPTVTTLLATLAVAGAGDQESARRAYDSALRRLYPDAAAPPPRQVAWQQALDQGWAGLDGLAPKAKQALVEAMAVAVTADGTVTTAEAEMLRAACALMHVPLPALLT